MLNNIKNKILLFSIVIVSLLITISIIIYQSNKISELSVMIELQNRIVENNSLAYRDSIRHYINESNEKVSQKLGFVLDIQNKQDRYLKEQNYNLKSIQDIVFSIKDLIITTSGDVQITDSNATHTFIIDTNIVKIEGLTNINLKEKELSFTTLKLFFKKIPMNLRISSNEKGQILGTATSIFSEVEITSLETFIDDDFYKYYTVKEMKEESFFDMLRLAILLGYNPQPEFDRNKILYGFGIEYKNLGLYHITDGKGKQYQMKFSKSFGSFF